ncbi:hypothetical protein MNBD_IGNAVI01-269 [hydrothermal vent metagenome]|uniref:Secretion system C-terminal sorting domain-containing protein n=1 Tax=hydrothermal vent metagenome TaxID=652676 RepID=A0A3B1CXC8_9ZZZZ
MRSELIKKRIVMKTTRIKSLLFIMILSLTSTILAQTTPEWVRAYDQPDNRNKLYASTTDSEGNSYLTGASQVLNGNLTSDNFLTLKYDKNGDLLWVKTFDSGEGGIDEAHAIALDNEGNVYVTGFASSNSIELDEFYTIKYSSEGEEIWHAIFNGPETGGIKWNDRATYIFVDDNQNVYVTGTVEAYDDSTYYVHTNIGVVKYNSEGILKYFDVYDSPYHGDEVPTGISVNKYGHLFISGYTNEQNYYAGDMILLMYDNSGNLKWNVQYDGSESADDKALMLVTDKEGNAYFCGYQNEQLSGGTADLFIAKYDTTGTQVWSDVINSTIEGIDPNLHYPVAMEISPDDNLYIHAYNTGFENFLTKYDLDGTRKWISFWNGTTNIFEPSNIVFDSENNIYVMGHNDPSGWSEGDVLGMAKFDLNGIKTAELFYEDYISDNNGVWGNIPIGIGIDKENSIYLTGTGGISGHGHAFELVKFPRSINAVDDKVNNIVEFKLDQNYPNPFNPSTTISFSIDKQEYVELTVYNSLGQLVTKLLNEDKPAGNYNLVFNAANLPSGVYYYRLFTGNKTMTKKCILMK